jgi:ABC-type sugar transport system permease subunit
VFFVPTVVALPVLAIIWSILYQPPSAYGMGLINQGMNLLGLPPQAWLQDPLTALPAIAFMSIWQGVGLQMMVFLAALQGVSHDQLEAASMDGANAWQRLVHVIVPGVRPTIAFVVTVTTVLAFRLFVQPYLMTRGGPDDRTLSVIQYIYETTFLQRNLGLACAAAVLFLAVVAAVMLVQQVIAREERA